MRFASSASSGRSKRHSSTPVACSEKRAKFVPSPSHDAPSGYGEPGQTRRLATRAPQDDDRVGGGGDRPAGRGDRAGAPEPRVGGIEQPPAGLAEGHVEEARLVPE